MHYDPLDPATIQCPFDQYRVLRADAPVYFADTIGSFVVTRHDLISDVLRDPATFSSRRGRSLVPLAADEREQLVAVQNEGYPRLATLLTADPPKHTRFRRLVSKAFSPPIINARESMIRETTVRLIDSWGSSGRIEFVEQFAVPLPVEVIAKLLNVPDGRMGDFKRWSDDTIVGFGNVPTLDELLASERGVNGLQHYFAAELADRVEHPRGDLLSALLDARVDDDPEVSDPRPLDTTEILSIIQQLLVGGNETTTKMLTEMMWRLASDPQLFRRVREQPELIPSVVEEAVRLASPVQANRRVATREVQLGGVTIPEGAHLVLVFGAANRDELVFSDPEEFNPDRDDISDHLGFGRGVHFCVGASLARLEGRVALEELSRRLHSVAVVPERELRYHDSYMLRGLLGLELDVTVA